ncbi:MAG TPA: MBL fold metallo-hydrolase [Actinomycetota bacterium]|nr:MBL fold metallo-hydrolase [Actinomycetota bacterium]
MRVIRVLAPNPGIRELEGTNTWVVGNAPAVVIDPGPDTPEHLREVERTAGRVGAIALTHDHPDHAPGAARLASWTGARVLAARPANGMVRASDGDTVASNGVTLDVIATPGHSPDHVAFFERGTRALFTGDAVLGRGTSVIDPPEGDLVAYLRSLRRMLELGPRTIYPGHGPVALNAAAKLEEYLEHRAMREEQMLAALDAGPRTPAEIATEIYEGYPPEVLALAERSVLAHLLKLRAEGRVDKRTEQGEVRWSRIEPRQCARCGRPVRGRARLCNSCSLAVLQESS